MAAGDGAPEPGSVALFGAPFDGTASYRGGARLGPARIREASYSLEEYSLRLDASLEDVRFVDVGDLDLPHGSAERALEDVARTVVDLAHRGAVPLMLGGEHLLTLGAVRALAEQHPDLAVIQFDAHADLRDAYQGERLSHATVMRRVAEVVGSDRVFPLGIRSGSAGEVAWGRAHTRWPQPRHDLPEQAHAAAAAAGRRPVYVTIDIDVLDPAEAPGTGTPEPGGVCFNRLLTALDALRGLRIVGCDLVEVAPSLDPSGRTEVAAAAVCRHLLIGWFGTGGGSRR
ncbi:MAG TPA: agmatinase [Bacillota bacterium]